MFPISAIYRHVTPWLLIGGVCSFPMGVPKVLAPAHRHKKSTVFLISKLIQFECGLRGTRASRRAWQNRADQHHYQTTHVRFNSQTLPWTREEKSQWIKSSSGTATLFLHTMEAFVPSPSSLTWGSSHLKGVTESRWSWLQSAPHTVDEVISLSPKMIVSLPSLKNYFGCSVLKG